MLPSTFELIQKSYALYKKNWALFLKYTTVLSVPLLITTVLRFYFGNIFVETASYRQLAPAAVIIFLLYLLTLWATITLIRVVSNSYNGIAPKTLSKEYLLSRPLLFPSLWAIILMGCAVFGGLILLVIPGIIFSLWFFFSVYAVVLDNKKGTNSLNFSKMLVRGHWWDVFWLIFSTTLLILGASSIVQSMIGFILTWMLESHRGVLAIHIAAFFLTFVLSLMVAPLSAGVPTILYNELKKIKNV